MFNREQFAKDLAAHMKAMAHYYERSVRGYARQVGVSHMMVDRFLKCRCMDLAGYARLCRFMGCSMDYYFPDLPAAPKKKSLRHVQR